MRNLEARVIHAENMVAVLREVVDQLQAETERLAKLTEAR